MPNDAQPVSARLQQPYVTPCLTCNGGSPPEVADQQRIAKCNHPFTVCSAARLPAFAGCGLARQSTLPTWSVRPSDPFHTRYLYKHLATER